VTATRSPQRFLLAHLARRSRRSSIVWSLGFAVSVASVAAGYRAAYPTLAQRLVIARQLVSNLGFQALYGRAGRLETVGGFTAWRSGGTLTVLAAVWGLLLVTRLGRGDEETGSHELVVGGALTARDRHAAVVAVAAAWSVVAGALVVLTAVACTIPVTGSLLLGAELMLAGLLGVGLGALAGQLVTTRRRASGWAGAAVGVAVVLRVLADGTTGLGWVRWSTPFGWLESTQAGSPGERWWPLVGPIALSAGAAALAVSLGARRDLGAGLVGDHDHGPAAGRRSSSPAPLAVRLAVRSLAGWSVSLVAAGLVLGLLASDVARFARSSPGYASTVAKLGVADPGRPAAFIGLAFSLLVVALAAAAAGSVAAGRDHEAGGALALLAAGPLRRSRWLLAHATTSAAEVVVLATLAGGAAWLGTALQGSRISLVDGLGAGWNLVPVVLVVLGIGTLVHGLAPRAAGPAAIVVIVGGYLLQLVGALAHLPRWVRDVSPFEHVAPFPAADVRPVATVVMVLLGTFGIVVGALAIDRRDEVLA
jgi:ABC-2 type transport system permease protein